MKLKRAIFWSVFVIILILIVWGLIAAMNRPIDTLVGVGTPAPVTVSDNILGDVNAPVVLIEYGDFECPACSIYAQLVDRLFKESSSTMSVVFRHFPLSQHPNALGAAQASEAAANQGKFWEMYDSLYGNQNEWVDKSTDEARLLYESYAREIGLDMTRFKIDEVSSTTLAKVRAEQEEGVNIGINHTPTFFVNGREFSPNTYEDFKTTIDTAIRGATK